MLANSFDIKEERVEYIETSYDVSIGEEEWMQ